MERELIGFICQGCKYEIEAEICFINLDDYHTPYCEECYQKEAESLSEEERDEMLKNKTMADLDELYEEQQYFYDPEDAIWDKADNWRKEQSEFNFNN